MRDLDPELPSNDAKSPRQPTLVKTLIGEENNMLLEEQRIWHIHIQETSGESRILPREQDDRMSRNVRLWAEIMNGQRGRIGSLKGEAARLCQEKQRLLGQWVALHKKGIDFLSEQLSGCAEKDGNKISERLTELKKTTTDYSELARVSVSKTVQVSPSSSF